MKLFDQYVRETSQKSRSEKFEENEKGRDSRTVGDDRGVQS
jgi:hypothetical protein